MEFNRRSLLRAGAASLIAAGAVASPALAADIAGERTLLSLGRELLNRNAPEITKTDLVGIANYAAPSWRPRFHLVDMANGRVSSFLVAHGRGSDPGHTGWLRRFSNDIGSNASSSGAYLTGDLYVGKHGRSMRLEGLGPENSNAEKRAIVVHGAWYVSNEMIDRHGKLGRSEGCFAFSETDLDEVLTRLGPGRLLYAGRL